MRTTIYILVVILFTFTGGANASGGSQEKDISAPSEMAIARQYIDKGKDSGSEKKYDEALEYFRKAELIMPDDEELLFDIGLTLRNLGRYEDALKYFKKVVETNPYAVPAIGNIAEIHRNLKQFPEAIDSFRRILDLKSNDDGAIVNLADIYFKQKEYEECHKYIVLFKKNLESKNVILLTRQDQEQIRKALDRFDVYITVINNEANKETNKVKSSF